MIPKGLTPTISDPCRLRQTERNPRASPAIETLGGEIYPRRDMVRYVPDAVPEFLRVQTPRSLVQTPRSLVQTPRSLVQTQTPPVQTPTPHPLGRSARDPLGYRTARVVHRSIRTRTNNPLRPA